MHTRLLAFSVVLALSSAVYAGENPTLEEVNANPSKFAGQTITFQKVSLYGNVASAQLRFRFTVKSPKGTIFRAQPTDQPEQKIVFATRNKKDKAKEFVNTLSPEYYYTVNLTVHIQQMPGKGGEQGRFWANVESIDHLPTLKGYKSK